jgi:hypothetical protein
MGNFFAQSRTRKSLPARLGVLGLTFLLFAVHPGLFERAQACASCGSGSGAPLVLAPNEASKFYLGTSVDFGFRAIDDDGGFAKDSSISSRNQVTLSAAQSLTPRTFVSLTLPYVFNRTTTPAPRGASDWGDPLLQLRTTVLMPDLSATWKPQIQGILGHRFVGGPSIRDSCQSDCVVKATGSGTAETELGGDVWWAMSAIKWGVAQTILFPTERRFPNDVTFENGRGYSTIATVGMAQEGLGKINAGLIRTEREEIRVNGATVAGSRAVKVTVFVTTDYSLDPLNTIRLTASRGGWGWQPLGEENSSSFNSISVAWLAALANP